MSNTSLIFQAVKGFIQKKIAITFAANSPNYLANLSRVDIKLEFQLKSV